MTQNNSVIPKISVSVLSYRVDENSPVIKPVELKTPEKEED